MSFRQTGIKITEKKGKFVNEKKTKNFIQDTHTQIKRETDKEKEETKCSKF